MKKAMGGLVAGILTFQLLPGGAFAADCANQADAAALKIAALQQELMVAAFSCHDVARYNNFVVSHQPELIASDGNLKSFFERRDGNQRGEAAYHTYKTELANGASLDYLRDDGFCDRAAGEFAQSDDSRVLASFVGLHRWAGTSAIAFCPGAEPVIQTASIDRPRRATHDDQYRNRDDRSADAYGRGGYDRDRDGWTVRADGYGDRYDRDDNDARGRSGDEDRDGYAAPAPHHRMEADDR